MIQPLYIEALSYIVEFFNLTRFGEIVLSDIWIVRDSVELLPDSSGGTYFYVQEDVYPIIMNVVLCNVNKIPVNLVCETTSGPYSLVNAPFIALGMGVIPVILIALIYNGIKLIANKSLKILFF